MSAVCAITKDAKRQDGGDASCLERAIKAVQRDNAHRYAGVRDDVFGFNELGPFRPWAARAWNDHSIPLLIQYSELWRRQSSSEPKNDTKLYRWSRVNSEEAYRKPLYQSCPMLRDICGKGRFVLAGGLVSLMLTGKPLNYSNRSSVPAESDVDLFLVGVDEATARRRIQELAEYLYGYWHHRRLMRLKDEPHPKDQPDRKLQDVESSANDDAKDCAAHDRGEDGMVVYRNDRCISFRPKRQPSEPTVQVILRLYGSVSELIHGFDLGSSAVADDGERLYFTSLSKLAYESAVNVVDTTRRRPTYELRICKYFERGFAVAMPHFSCAAVKPSCSTSRDMNGWQVRTVKVDLPYLRIDGEAVEGTQSIYCHRDLKAARPGPDGRPQYLENARHAEDDKAQTMDAFGSTPGPYESLPRLTERNFRLISAAARQSTTSASAAATMLQKGLCAFTDFRPQLDVLSVPVSWTLLPRVLASCCQDGRLEISRLNRLLGHIKLTEEFVKGWLGCQNLSYSEQDAFFTGFAHKLLNHSATHQAAKTVILAFRFTSPTDGTAINPPASSKVSLVGSSDAQAQFPMAVVSEQQWYGKFYRPLKI